MSRGFLPRGLSNTCPQVCATRSAVASHGQVSNKPKQKMPVFGSGTVIYWAALRAMGISDRFDGFGSLLAQH